jgi:hypothetical protein
MVAPFLDLCCHSCERPVFSKDLLIISNSVADRTGRFCNADTDSPARNMATTVESAGSPVRHVDRDRSVGAAHPSSSPAPPRGQRPRVCYLPLTHRGYPRHRGCPLRRRRRKCRLHPRDLRQRRPRRRPLRPRRCSVTLLLPTQRTPSAKSFYGCT